MHRLKWALAVALLSVSPIFLSAQEIGTVNFDFDSDHIDATAEAKIREIAQQLRDAQSYKPTVVVGYTDAMGSSGYNQGLGMRRARAVANELIALGVPVDRIGTVASRGENDLLVRVATPERLNRRVTVQLEDILAACRSYRQIQLAAGAIGPSLEQDLRVKLATASRDYETLSATGTNGPAFQMAGNAREDCGIAVGFDERADRKLEYSKRCLCSSARLEVAAGRAPVN